MEAIFHPTRAFLKELVGTDCYNALFVKGGLASLSPTCYSIAASKFTSLAILGVCSVLKVPQIAAINKSRSVDGLSLASYLIEVLCFSVMVAYHLKQGTQFSVYGEVVLLLIQDAIIMYLWAGIKKSSRVFFKYAILDILLAALLVSPLVNNTFMATLSSATLPINIVGGFVQIAGIYNQGHTGELSPLMVLIGWLTGLARLLTLALDGVSDYVIVVGSLTGVLLSTVLMSQLFIFRDATNKFKLAKNKLADVADKVTTPKKTAKTKKEL